jgi:UDP-N-acetylglucosamine--N-acetylmuramyl-(pentapeptide) pyrophosphoryl-undecaprenol N-acetylglucosamine transferase
MNTVSTDISSAVTPTTASESVRILVAAGGTGGHVYPGIALADQFRKRYPGSSILFVGTKDRMEATAVPGSGYDFRSVWISGFHRRLTPVNLMFPLKLMTSLVQSYRILKQFRPDVVISCGGFASGPVGWVASKMGIPLVLQEQNSFPGVTTRMLAKHADLIFTAFEDAADWLPKEKVRLTGNPVRSELTSLDRDDALNEFDFESGRQTLLILGGSGGAKTINDAVTAHLEWFHDELGLQIIWQCGKKYYNELFKMVRPERFSRLRLMEFIDRMPAAYAAADLVVSRAGALSCSELMIIGKPSILIPSPHVAGDHQMKNARSMSEKNAAYLLNDEEAVARLGEVVTKLLKDEPERSRMKTAAFEMSRQNAAARIADEIDRLRRHEA